MQLKLNSFPRLAAVLAASVLLLAGCKTEVYQGLTEDQANDMMLVLMKHGIAPEKTSAKTGFSLAVESDDVARTLELMRENNLPRPAFENRGEIFAAKGMISSSMEEQARLTYAIQQELAETFSQIDGVLTSRVHVVLGSEDPATGKTTPPSAAVFLRYTPDSQAPNLVARMQVLTADAVPGLDRSRVSVMLVPVRETVTVPMKTQESAASTKLYLIGSAILALLGAAGLGAGFWFWNRTRKLREGAADGSSAS